MPFALSQTAAPGHLSAADEYAAIKKNHAPLAGPLLAALKEMPTVNPPFTRRDDRYTGRPVFIAAVIVPSYPNGLTIAWEVRTIPPAGEQIAYILDLNVAPLS